MQRLYKSYDVMEHKLDITKPDKVPSWLENCTNIYMDLGSNIGVQVKKFFEPEKYKQITEGYYGIVHQGVWRTWIKKHRRILDYVPLVLSQNLNIRKN